MEGGWKGEDRGLEWIWDISKATIGVEGGWNGRMDERSCANQAEDGIKDG